MADPAVASLVDPAEAFPFDGALFDELARMTPGERLDLKSCRLTRARAPG